MAALPGRPAPLPADRARADHEGRLGARAARRGRRRASRCGKLKEAGVEAVAVCFLFSFVNAEHEQRVAEIVREEFPEAFLSVSSEVLPQYREYERFSTVCLNAYIGPKVATYVSRLKDELARARRADGRAPDDLGVGRGDGRGARSRGR